MAGPDTRAAFDACLMNGRLKRVEPDPDKIHEETRTAIYELCRARYCYADGDNEDCVVQSFFSMNRILRVLLQRLGYRDTNVYSMLAGLNHLYVEPGRLAPHVLAILKLAKDQKDLVQGGARCGRKETKLILSGAEETMQVARTELALGRIPELDEPPAEAEETSD